MKKKKLWKNILLVCIGLLSLLAIIFYNDLQLLIYRSLPPKYITVHIADQEYERVGISLDEIEAVADKLTNRNRQRHDREVHFGNLKYCHDFIVYRPSPKEPDIRRIFPATYYFSREDTQRYCTTKHSGPSGKKPCPPARLECGACPTFNCAIHVGHIENVKKLILNGEDVNQIIWNDVHTFYTTPLHLALEKKNAELVKLLIENGANLEAKDAHGLTPLFSFVRYTFNPPPEIVRMLLQAGAKPQMRRGFNKISFAEYTRQEANKNTSKTIRNDIIGIAEQYQ